MKKFFAVAVTLFLLIFAWTPAASAEETDPAVAVAEAAVIGISKVSEAYAAAHADEIMTREELAAKAADLRQESGLYKTTAKIRKTMEDTPIFVKYLGEKRYLSGIYNVTEYTYLLRDTSNHAVLDIKAATADAELGFVNMRLSRLEEKEVCRAKSSLCDSATADAERKNKEAQESLLKVLQTMRVAIP